MALPYPTQQILLHDQTEATDGDRKTQREGWPAGQGEVPKSRQQLRKAEAQKALEAGATQPEAARAAPAPTPAQPEKSAAPAPAG